MTTLAERQPPFSGEPPSAPHRAGRVLPHLLLALFVSLPLLAGVFLLLPSLASPPGLPSGKAPLEVLVEGFRAPTGVAPGPDGTLFFTDEKEGNLFQRDPDGNLVLLDDNLVRPRGIARAEDGTLFLVAESLRGHRVGATGGGLLLKRTPDGTLTILASGFRGPQQVTLDPDGRILLSTTAGLRRTSTEVGSSETEDRENEDDGEERGDEGTDSEEQWHRIPTLPGTIFKLSPEGAILDSHDGFLLPSGLAVTEDGAVAIAAQLFKDDGPLLKGSLFRLAHNGEVTVVLPELFAGPTGLVHDVLGQFYLAVKRARAGPGHGRDEPRGGLILKVAPDGEFTTFAQGFERHWGLAFDPHGNLYASDPKAGRIYRFRAPAAPTLADHATATNQQTIALTGTSDRDARMTARGGQEDVSALADPEGNFSIEVSLKPGQSNSLKVYATAARGEGLSSVAATATIIRDNTPPTIAFVRPTEGSQLSGSTPVEIEAEDTLSGIAAIEFLVDAILQGSRTEPPFSFLLDPAAFAPGRHILTARAVDRAGNAATASIEVEFGLLPPTLTRFEPTSGKVGATVTLTGTHFDANTAGNTITLNGVAADVLGATATQLFTRVPQGATNGSIAVRTAGGTATSTGHFLVLPTQDFTLTAAPATAPAQPGGRAGVLVSTTGLEGFTGLVNLGLSGVPAGVVGRFDRPAVAPGQSSSLLIDVGPTAQPGSFALMITGSTSIEGTPVQRTASATLQILSPGQTSLAGRILDTDGLPVPAVTIRLGSLTTTTDAAGSFVLLNPPTGTQIVFLDGSTASTPQVSFPTIPVTVNIAAGQVNPLPFQPHFHRQKARNFTNISNSGVQRSLTDPEVPGFSLTVPVGVTITGWDGQPNAQISVQSIPLDRLPLPPLPEGGTAGSLYMFFFGKTGGGTPSAPIPITVPNDVGALPGETLDLFYFDDSTPTQARSNTWQIGGTGTVTADGKQIVTTAGGIRQFCCGASFFRRPPPPPTTPPALAAPSRPPEGAGAPSGDPLDLSTGLFILEKTDMVLPGRVPVALTRTYRTNDASPGPFGLGTSHPYEIFLQAQGTDLLILFLPGNSRSFWARQPDGAFKNDQVPAYRGATIAASLDGSRMLRWKDGSTWRFDTNGRLIAQSDRNGNTVTITRDGQGRATTIAEPGGRSLTFTYDSTSFRVSSVTDPIGRTVGYSYDGNGRLIRVRDPAGGLTGYTYDAQNRLLTITDPRGITFLTNEYDANGRVARQTQADGGVWTFAYTLSGGVVTQAVVTDPRGNTTTHRFNNSGYTIEQTDALGQSAKLERAFGTNLLLSTTDPLGRVTRLTYDGNGNVTSITDPAGNVRSFEYEPTFNKLTKIADPLGNITQFAYDTNGNLSRITDPLGNATQIAYNQFGQPVSTTDPLGNVTQFEYDTVGNLRSINDPLGNTTQRTYDPVSRLIAQIDPRGKTTNFSFDDLNRISQIVDALAGVTGFTYDGNGNLLTVTDARGSVTTHAYDSMDRLATRTDPLNRSESFSYDPNGNLTQFTNRKSQVSNFTYDPLNRRTRSNFADGTSTEFTFDTAGRLTRATDSQTGTIVEEYDVLDRLIRETTPQGTISYAYDALGRRQIMTADGQPPVAYTYDASSRLRTIAQSSLPSPVTIDYDALGRRTLLALPNGVSTEYQYDVTSRLTALIYRNATGPLGDLTYEYDPVGNRTGVGGSFARTLLPDPVLTSAYDAANQQLAFGDKTMTFDANGNLTTITDPTGTTTLTWDARNRLTALSGPGTSAALVYDMFGRRVEKTVNGRQSQFQYDIVNINVELRDGNPVTYLRGLSVDEVFGATDGSGTRYATTDTLGSMTNLTDESGSIQAEYRYGPFGETQRSGQDGANPFQFTGRENDGTGLYYYRLRYHHPTLGRFISQDPLRPLSGADLNHYAYVSNSPLNAVDPFGLYEEDVHRDLTYFLARHAGYPQAAARRIAASNQGTDDNPETSPFASVQARRDWHFTTEERRAELGQRALDGNFDHLGQYLHALQDSYSHEGFGPRFGHAIAGHAPDKTYNDPEKANRMARDTYNRVRQYLQAITGQPVPDYWDQIRDQVDRFNRARTAHEKRKILGR